MKYKVQWVAPGGKMVVIDLPTIIAKNKKEVIKEAKKRTVPNAIFTIKKLLK